MYKLEIFTDQMKYADSALIPDQTVELDFLTFEAFTVLSRPVNCKKGYFIHLTDGGALVCDGIVSDVQPATGTVTISVRPLQAVFDCEVYRSQITDVVSWIEQQITDQFIENQDDLQNRPVAIHKAVRAVYPIADTGTGDTINRLEVMTAALIAYGIVCLCWLDMEAMMIAVEICQPSDEITLEADKANVLDKTVTLGDSYGAANKMVVRRKVTNQETGEISYSGQSFYYLHPDGTIDQNNTDRITPVFWKLKDLDDSDTWDQEALEAAVEELTPQQYDNEIILLYAAEDNLVYPATIPIGTKAKIYLEGTVYKSILTGRILKSGTIELTFGQVRSMLTKKLIMERRR